MMRALLLILLIGFINNICYTQSNVNITDRRNIFDEKGDYYFDRNDYKKAIVYYNMAYSKDASNYYSVLRKAEAYSKLELYPQASECYRIIFKTNLRIANNYRLQYAFILLAENKISEFEHWIRMYNEIVESEIQGKNYISSVDDRVKLYKDSTIVIVENEAKLNTAESEICPVAFLDQIIFASTRKSIKGDKGSGSYNIYSASHSENGDLGKIRVFNKNLNTSQNEGSICFFDVNNSMYFTRSTSQKTNLKTYNSNIPADVNDALDVNAVTIEGFNNIGQLTLNSNGTTMFFVSDAPGGSGGLDIYSSNLIEGKWATPKNLGELINSSGDEMYPFIFNDSILFFTSDGHDGLGGLDLFRVNLNNVNTKVENLGAKINSEYDDYSLSMNSDGITGYFASNRPGGIGKDDIYRVHILNLKVKYAAYAYKKKTSMEEDKINLYLSNGDDYNIASKDKSGFNFGFLPEEDYLMIIQHENTTVENVINNHKLTTDQKEKEFLKPAPLEKAEIKLQAGMKYQFTAGINSISPQYNSSLIELSQSYQDENTNTIDLTALAKELLFTEGELYTIRFVKDDRQTSAYKAKGESSLFINEQIISVYGQSFFIVLPLDTEVRFNIQTDLEYFKENFNPKKYSVDIDNSSIFTEKPDLAKGHITMLVNTDSIENIIAANRLTVDEISIIPGTEYILTLGRTDPFTGEEVEIIVPLTRGVKYNLGSTELSKYDYKKALAELITGREGVEPSNEEVIDISVLSKELEVQSGEDLSFSLLPAKQFGKKAGQEIDVKTILSLDGKTYNISRAEKYTINVPFNTDGIVNIQTDINYILDNYSPEDIILIIDTIPFFSEITVDTTGYAEKIASGWLVSMSVNTNSTEDVEKQNQLIAKEVSILPGREYILTVTKKDAETGKETEIIVPLTREVKYDFTSKPDSRGVYKESFDKFLQDQEGFSTADGEVIDISIISKELEIKEGDDVSISLLPAKVFRKDLPKTEEAKSSLYLDNKVVEFTEIQKYTINIPLNSERQLNIRTDVEQVQENFNPGSYKLIVDTANYGNDDKENVITDPVFDVITVNFDLNSYSLRPEAKNTIESKVVNVLKSDNRLYVTIKGFTDALGDAGYNKKLSKNRALSVKDFLTGNDIGEARIRTFSFGESQMLKEGVNWEDLDEAELSKHRKVEIVIYLPK
jgi:outer membrane protein OmpA-like peptidoglycan-associated protein/tetratricopeptide (TPR) repeat protein